MRDRLLASFQSLKMSLNLYRRHRRECDGRHAEDSRSGELQERSKGWKKCSCPIFASGVLGDRFRRRKTGQATWDAAKGVVAAWHEAGRWDGVVAPPAAVQEPAGKTGGITIDRAVKAFLADHDEHSAPNTIKKYGLLMKKLQAFSVERGYVGVARWTPLDVREFRSSWNISVASAAKHMSTLRSFFEFCVVNGWLDGNPAKLVKNPRRRRSDTRNDQKLPFSDEELGRMFAACENKYGRQEVKWSRTIHHHRVSGEYVRYNFKWTGKDLADFIAISVYTGLRISDVCTFNADRLLPSGECHIRTTKTGVKVFTWIPDWLQKIIRERALKFGPLIFGEHSTDDMNVVTDVWRRKFKKLWKLCGPWPEKPTPHRFRHTFARILLQRANVTVRDVAELLGNTEQMVRKHYSAWVPERQERLTAILREAFEEKPRPANVVEILPKAAK
jgi:integrase